MAKKCLSCNEEIIGRSDKKFCSDYCRNSYNNKIKGYSNSYLNKINYILKKNRRIIEEFNPEGKATVHKTKLINAGFDFNYFTNIYTTKTGKTYYFCYEYGYLPIDNDFYALVRRDYEQKK